MTEPTTENPGTQSDELPDLLPMDETDGGRAACTVVSDAIREAMWTTRYRDWAIANMAEVGTTATATTFTFTAQDRSFRAIVERAD